MNKFLSLSFYLSVFFLTCVFIIEKAQANENKYPKEDTYLIDEELVLNSSTLYDGIEYIILNSYMQNDDKLAKANTNFGNEKIIEDNDKNNTIITNNTNRYHIHLVKIDPAKYQFNLYGNFLEEKEANYTLPTWSKEKELLIAINASMYLKDDSTSTGYMRSYTNFNNDHIAKSMSGFFLAQPKNNEENATIIEKESHDLKTFLEEYNVAVQNFRMIGNFDSKTNCAEILWAKDTKKHPIAAYGNDVNGFIYFIFSQAPTTANELALFLLSLQKIDINFKNVLYAEGGKDAALYIQAQDKTIYISGIGSTALDFLAPIPNIIGVKKK